MDVQYRWLNGVDATDEEWARIDEILAARGWMSLNRNTSRIRVAEDGSGKLLGFLVLELLPHVGPEWVAPSARASGIAQRLADDMAEYLAEVRCRGWIVIAQSEHGAKIAEEHGMRKLDCPVYVIGGG